MADSLVLVTGATGTVGTAVLADLKGKPGIKLRALARNPDKAATLVEDAVKASRHSLDDPEAPLLHAEHAQLGELCRVRGMLYMNLGEGRVGTIDGRDVGLSPPASSSNRSGTRARRTRRLGPSRSACRTLPRHSPRCSASL